MLDHGALPNNPNDKAVTATHKLVTLSMTGVVVDDGNEVVADVTLLLVALRVSLQVGGHQGGNVKYHLWAKV